jgi:hypothetical protein
MIRYFLIFIFSLTFLFSTGQNTDIKKNALSLEIAGTGILYSFNYDRMLLINENMRFAVNIGTWYIPPMPSLSDFNYMIGGTVGFSTLFGKTKHFAELGLNLSYINMKDIDDNVFHTLYQPIRIGYRFQKDEGGLFLRAAFMPMISIVQDPDAEFLYPVTPNFSASIGFSF